MPHTPHRARLLRLAFVALCAAITAAGAFITVPLPIPVTMQLLGVFFSGFFLGPACGAAAQAVYVVAGLAGLPIFAGAKGGPSVVAGPTFGYIVAFPVAAAVVGAISKNKPSPRTATIAIAAATATVYTLGVAWIMLWAGAIAGKRITLGQAISIGAIPFLPFDIVKGYVAYALARALWRAKIRPPKAT